MTKVFQLAYISESTPGTTDQDIASILKVACAYNATHSITGLLVYNAGHYMQFLEGPYDATLTCFERVRRDPRHKAVHRFFEGTATTRSFPAWTMAYRNFESYEPFLRTKFEQCLFEVTRSDIVFTPASALEILGLFARTW